MKIKLLVFCALILITAAAHADNAAPLPAIVQKYVAAVKSVDNFTMTVTQTEPKAGPPDTGEITLVPKRDVIRVISNFGRGQYFKLTADWGDKIITQLNKTQIYTQPEPKSLAELNPVLPIGAAASIGLSLLTDATTITDYANLKDVGPAMMDGQAARKVVSIEDGDTATFWIATETKLPLMARFTGGRHNRTIAFHYHFGRVNDPYYPFFPVAPPPKGLTVYTPPAETPLLAVGTPAPDFTLPRLSQYGTGKSTVTLSALKGKPVLIDFWASWCRPCKKTMPHIQELHAKAGQQLTVISLNTWDTPARAAAFLKSHPQYSTQFVADFAPSDAGIAVSKYKVSGIPTVYIIDKDGNVAGAFAGDDPATAAQIEATLSKLGVAL